MCINSQSVESLVNLATSPLAKELGSEISLAQIEQAEQTVKALLDKFTDNELKFEIDTAIGKISLAYQLFGFVVGHVAHELGW